jgi:hypothetical protein
MLVSKKDMLKKFLVLEPNGSSVNYIQKENGNVSSRYILYNYVTTDIFLV